MSKQLIWYKNGSYEIIDLNETINGKPFLRKYFMTSESEGYN